MYGCRSFRPYAQTLNNRDHILAHEILTGLYPSHSLGYEWDRIQCFGIWIRLLLHGVLLQPRCVLTCLTYDLFSGNEWRIRDLVSSNVDDFFFRYDFFLADTSEHFFCFRTCFANPFRLIGRSAISSQKHQFIHPVGLPQYRLVLSEIH